MMGQGGASLCGRDFCSRIREGVSLWSLESAPASLHERVLSWLWGWAVRMGCALLGPAPAFLGGGYKPVTALVVWAS